MISWVMCPGILMCLDFVLMLRKATTLNLRGSFTGVQLLTFLKSLSQELLCA